MNNWSQLRPLSKLDQLAETIMKSAFLLSENHNVIQSYLNHKGANFKIHNRVGESEYDILCRQINIEKTNYAFVPKSDLERGLRDDLWVGLVLFIDGEKPSKYLFSSTVWNEPNQLFTDTSVKNPEYGINLNKYTMKEFVEKYAFEKMILEL
ncbi:hypothetical protein N7E81_14710 [Reichenbachiella carrageenanivorans]|uniref:Uncharacterized protein n=1 Tax=Reichenbachiella carrageenanivorans TaxID=2979869 RepID=A0ABY6CXH5_9BACT|nr:hypothetical protein [Reichenbachiella carrageenanivorans]UXX78610.1 hypothetical protein N7E81_14710 [Reichenbachiella carrageenanivorans]